MATSANVLLIIFFMTILFLLLNKQNGVSVLSIQRKYSDRNFYNRFDEKQQMLDVILNWRPWPDEKFSEASHKAQDVFLSAVRGVQKNIQIQRQKIPLRW
jgi:hypothetical protein